MKSLRSDEITHLKVLKTLKKLMEERNELLKEVKEEFSLTEEEAKTVIEDIDSHIEAEANQKERIRKMMDLCGDVPARRKLRWILDDEEIHHDLLEEVSQRIKREYDL